MNYATPACRWACDDPVCHATCRINVLPVVCSYASPPDGAPAWCASAAVVADVECSPTQDATAACPQCTARAPSHGTHPECGDLSCHEIQASWVCAKPEVCPPPTCELQCEAPACACASDCAYAADGGDGADAAEAAEAGGVMDGLAVFGTLLLVLVVAAVAVLSIAQRRGALSSAQPQHARRLSPLDAVSPDKHGVWHA